MFNEHLLLMESNKNLRKYLRRYCKILASKRRFEIANVYTLARKSLENEYFKVALLLKNNLWSNLFCNFVRKKNHFVMRKCKLEESILLEQYLYNFVQTNMNIQRYNLNFFIEPIVRKTYSLFFYYFVKLTIKNCLNSNSYKKKYVNDQWFCDI